MDASHVSDELLTASTALAGLILVFVGNAVAGYDSYDARQQHAVKQKYQNRGWTGFVGFVAALGSALFALIYNWICAAWLVYVSAFLLFFSLASVCFAAFVQVKEIK